MGLEVKGVIEHGDPAEVILEIAANEEVDLIVMGAHPHGWLDSLLLNVTSQEVVRRAHCPVLVYREGTTQASQGEKVPAVSTSA